MSHNPAKAYEVIKHLTWGVFCIFKPKNRSTHSCINRIKDNLLQGLNRLEQRPVQRRYVVIRTPLPGMPLYQHKILKNGEINLVQIDDGQNMKMLENPVAENSETGPLVTTDTSDALSIYQNDNFVYGDDGEMLLLDEKSKQRVIRNTAGQLIVKVDVPDLSDHPLVIGPRFISEKMRVIPTNNASLHKSSGVLGINQGIIKVKKIEQAKYVRTYHVKGQLGIATDDGTDEGNTLYRTTYHNVTRERIRSAISRIQAQHQRMAFEWSGVDLQSEEAYKMAVQGLIKPLDSNNPAIIYGIKLIDYKLPYFTLEIHSIDDSPIFFHQLIHDIGMFMKSSAVCTQIRRLRYGHFTLDHALVEEEWTLQKILENIELCKQLTTPKLLESSPTMRRLVQPKDVQLLDGGNQKLLPEGNEKLLKSGKVMVVEHGSYTRKTKTLHQKQVKSIANGKSDDATS